MLQDSWVNLLIYSVQVLHVSLPSSEISKAPVAISWPSIAFVKKKAIRQAYNLLSTHHDHQPGGALPFPKYWNGLQPIMIAKIITIFPTL